MTDAAVVDVDAITDYVAAFNLAAAIRPSRRIFNAADGLAESPDKGRPAGGQTRVWNLVYPYSIRYRVSGDEVIILRVRHGARRPLGRRA